MAKQTGWQRPDGVKKNGKKYAWQGVFKKPFKPLSFNLDRFQVPKDRPTMSRLGDHHSADVAELIAIHSYRRPHDTKAERAFIKRFIDSVPGMGKDGFGNRMITVGDSPTVCYSSHTDTVHLQPGKQPVRIGDDDIMTLTDGSLSDCLGADDGAGIWLMLEMIRAGRPGLYIFHRGEECGGLGSQWIAAKTPEIFDGVDYAIAFDRMGYDSVITHQGEKTASETFAESFASEVGVNGLYPDDTGLFTDTANYNHLVRECSNVSVGYHKQHGPNESLDLRFLIRMRDGLLNFDHGNLIVDRELDDFGYAPLPYYGKEPAYGNYAVDLDKPYERHDLSLQDAILDYPEVAEEILQAHGVTLDQFLQEVHYQTGVNPYECH
jgi:hypothetical protein